MVGASASITPLVAAQPARPFGYLGKGGVELRPGENLVIFGDAKPIRGTSVEWCYIDEELPLDAYRSAMEKLYRDVGVPEELYAGSLCISPPSILRQFPGPLPDVRHL